MCPTGRNKEPCRDGVDRQTSHVQRSDGVTKPRVVRFADVVVTAVGVRREDEIVPPAVRHDERGSAGAKPNERE